MKNGIMRHIDLFFQRSVKIIQRRERAEQSGHPGAVRFQGEKPLSHCAVRFSLNKPTGPSTAPSA